MHVAVFVRRSRYLRTILINIWAKKDSNSFEYIYIKKTAFEVIHTHYAYINWLDIKSDKKQKNKKSIVSSKKILIYSNLSPLWISQPTGQKLVLNLTLNNYRLLETTNTNPLCKFIKNVTFGSWYLLTVFSF